MAGTKTLLVKVAGDVTGARNAFSSLSGDADNLGHRLSSIGDRMTVGVTLPIVAGFTAATAAAATDAQEQAVLQHALEQNVGATDTLVASTEDWITSMQMATGVSDTQLRAAMTELVNKGSSVVESQTMIQAALDLAAGAGVGFEAAITALAKAADGNVTALSRMGIEVKNADGSARSLDEIMQQVADTMGGEAAAAADTAAGRMAIAQQRFGEAAETLGASLIPAMEVLSGVISTVSQWFDNLGGAGQKVIIVFALVAAAIGPILSVTGRLISVSSSVIGAFKNMGVGAASMGLAMGAVTVVIGALIIAHQQHAQQIQRVRDAITGLDADSAQLALTQELIAGGMTNASAAAAVVAVAYHTATAEQQAMVDGSWILQQGLADLEEGIRAENVEAAANAIAVRDAGKAAVEAATDVDTLHLAVVNQVEGMRGRWEPALATAAGSSRDLAGAQGDLQGKVSAATGAIEAQQSTLRAMTDPAFAYIQASQQLSDAQGTLALAQADSTTSAADLEAAQMDVVAAYIGVRDAAVTLRNDPASASVFSNTIDSALGVRGQLQGVKTDLADINTALEKISGRTVTFTVDGKYTPGANAAATFLGGRAS